MRIQLTVSKLRNEEIKRMMTIAGVTTKQELLKVALTSLNWAIKEVETGRCIMSIKEKSGHLAELVSPALSNVKRTDQ